MSGSAKLTVPLFRGISRRQWPLLPALAFGLIFLVYPVLQLLGLSFQTREGALTAAHYMRLAELPIYLQVLANSFKVATLTTLICLIGGYPVAYLLSNLRDSLRGTLLVWVLLPLWTSFLIRSIAWIILLTGKGVINSSLIAAGVIDQPLKLLYNFFGLMVGTVQGLMPVAVMMMLSVMMSIDRDLLRAAQTLGARPANQFWRIYLPLSAPGMISGALVVFVSSLGLFVTARLLGGPRDKMLSLLIIEQFEQVYDVHFAAVLSTILLLATLRRGFPVRPDPGPVFADRRGRRSRRAALTHPADAQVRPCPRRRDGDFVFGRGRAERHAAGCAWRPTRQARSDSVDPCTHRDRLHRSSDIRAPARIDVGVELPVLAAGGLHAALVRGILRQSGLARRLCALAADRHCDRAGGNGPRHSRRLCAWQADRTGP